MGTFFRLSHVSFPLWHWNICWTSLAGFAHSLGHAREVHDALVDITFPVGSSLDAIMAAHLSCLVGAFFVPSFRESQSTRECDVSCILYIFCQQDRRGFLNVALYIEDLRLVETLWPSAVFLLPYRAVGTLVKSLQFSYRILWDCDLGNPALWSYFHFCFASVSHSKFSGAHLSKGPVWW